MNIQVAESEVVQEKKAPVLLGDLLPEWEKWGYDQAADVEAFGALHAAPKVSGAVRSTGFYTYTAMDDYKAARTISRSL